ncbi:MAG: GNAT family N-acetyltransferase [Arenicella sp.]|nr:GNAT family N-acetyltransferase [Arenicella sp.]
MIFNFVQAKESDKEYLLELRKMTMLEHLERAGQFLSEKEHSERVNYKFEYSYLVFHSNQLIGAVKYHCKINQVELTQIQISPRHQGKGYGSGIVRQILNNEHPKTVQLAVLKGNPAVNFYKKLGFKVIGEDAYEYHMQNEPLI